MYWQTSLLPSWVFHVWTLRFLEEAKNDRAVRLTPRQLQIGVPQSASFQKLGPGTPCIWGALSLAPHASRS